MVLVPGLLLELQDSVEKMLIMWNISKTVDLIDIILHIADFIVCLSVLFEMKEVRINTEPCSGTKLLE